MTPISLTLERFGSFVERQVFDFPERPGLYFMQGQNLEEPRLQGNGAGKSTIWKALTWCLYGKDPKGLKAGDVANWEMPKGATVEFDFTSLAGEDLRIRRTHSPNSWTLSSPGYDGDKPSDLVANDKPATERIGLDYASWLNCVLMAQDEPMFLDLPASRKAELFSEVMGLDRWIEYAAKATKLSGFTESTIRALERAQADREGQLRGLASDDLHAAQDQWERDRESRLAALTVAYERDLVREQELQALLPQLREKFAEIELLVAQGACKAERCPECDQLIRDHDLDKLLREVDEARHKLRDKERDLATIERSLDQMEDRADEIKRERNPHVDAIKRRHKEQTSLRDELVTLVDNLRAATERREMLGFWVRGFKDLRLHLISESLEQLAIEVNSCVMALGLVDWELVFEVDRETKGGSIARGFSVYVRSPHNDRQVPWESWSGGEAQRLRLATQLGLANLIRSQTGASIALEVWDEPTKGMTPRGISDLLESLSARAREEQRVIFVVDHRTHDYGGFDGIATVTKDSRGSRVSWD